MKKLIFILIVLSWQLQAQQVVVEGIASGQTKCLVRLITYADQFSMLEETVAMDTVGADGSFMLSTGISQTQIALIALDLKKAEIFIEPNHTYSLKLDKESSEEKGSIYEQSPLGYEIVGEQGINAAIWEFNSMYNTFLLSNFKAIYQSRNSSVINEFKLEVGKRFETVSNKYFDNYVKYKIASLELASRKKDEGILIETYFLNSEILYNNVEYSSLFKEVFNNYFLSGISGIDYARLIETVNFSTNYKRIDELITEGNPKLASDRRLRELIGIIGLAKLYNTREFKRNNILKLLLQIERNSTFAEHREIAANYSKKLQKLKYKSPAPAFTFNDQNGNKVSSNDLKGEFTLLSFVQGDCGVCISQISQIDEIRQMFKGKLKMLTLVSGGKAAAIENFMYERDYEWPVLAVDNILLLEDFDIRVYPTYILLNPDGSIALAPTPMPDENLAQHILGMMKQWEKNN